MTNAATSFRAPIAPILNLMAQSSYRGTPVYTGQTTETFAPCWVVGTIPYCAPGSGTSGLPNDFGCGRNEQSVGIRMVSWVGESVSWRFGSENKKLSGISKSE